jgi:hypothetical protein
MRGIALNLHPAASAVALLTTPEFMIQKSLIDVQSCRHPREESDQSFPMRLSRCEITKHRSGLYPMN